MIPSLLKTGGSAWTAKYSDIEQYVTVDLGSKKMVTSIVTMGKQYSLEYVYEYRISYGESGGDFTAYKDRDGNVKVWDYNRCRMLACLSGSEPRIFRRAYLQVATFLHEMEQMNMKYM